MFSLYHNITLGFFDPENNRLGLDYKNLFNDPLRANMTIMHEQVHNALFKITDYGIATTTLYEIYRVCKPEYKDRIKSIIEFMASKQKTVQESTATFIEMEFLRRKTSKRNVEEYVESQMPMEYADRYRRLSFLKNASKKYRDFFTSKIPLIALQNGIRHGEVFQSIDLSNIDSLNTYICSTIEDPDSRFLKLVNAIEKNIGILKKNQKEIAEFAEVSFYEDSSKQDVLDFLNMLLKYSGSKEVFTIDQINGGKNLLDIVQNSEDYLLIGNLGLNISNTSMTLYKKEDLLHYKDEISAIFINRLDNSLVEGQGILEKYYQTKFEAGMIAFSNHVDKYLYVSSKLGMNALIEDEFSEIPLIVKSDLFFPNANSLNFFESKRLPNAVIYNNSRDLLFSLEKSNFQENFKYLVFTTSEDHPFQVFLFVDENEVVHIMNGFGRGIGAVVSKYKDNFVRGEINDFGSYKHTINAVLHIWNGLDPNLDWFSYITRNP